MKSIIAKLKAGLNWIKSRKKIISITLLISLLGGVPGIINIFKWVNDKPGFGFYPESKQDGAVTVGKQYSNWILINGAIFNNGDEPLFPSHFELEIKFEDTTLNSYASPMVDKFFNLNDAKYIIKSEKPFDLLKLIRLNQHDAAYGSLVFIYPFLNRDLNEIRSFKITCIDILGERRSMLINGWRYGSLPFFSQKTNMHIDSIGN